MNPPGASRAICGQCTVGGGPAGYRSRSFAQASQRCHAVSNSALASSSVGTFPLVTMPVLGFTYTVIDQHQRMSAGVLKPGNLVYAANRLAVVEDRPVLPVRIDRGVAAGRAHGQRHDARLCVGVNERFNSLFYVELVKHGVSVACVLDHFASNPSKVLHRKL
jgi:hypothetical protein